MRVRKALLASFVLAGVALPVHAELINRGNGLIYDTVLDVTWLQDANYARTSGYDADGRMTWDEAQQWVADLEYAGFDDWRLPKVTPANGEYFVYGDLPSQPNNSYSGLTDAGFNVAGPHSELGYMFYTNLGNKGFYSTTGVINWDWDNVNSGPFINLQHYFYWTGTEYVHAEGNFPNTPDFCAPPTYCAWDFVIGYGDQTIYQKWMPFYAWAVRDGDVTAEALLAVLYEHSIGAGPGKVLERKAELAQTYYLAGDALTACSVMSDYVLTLQAIAAKKVAKISPELAASLLADAQRVIYTIGCD